MTGILSEYNPDVLKTSKIREISSLILITKIIFLYQEETEDVKDIMTLYSYIKIVVQIMKK